MEDILCISANLNLQSVPTLRDEGLDGNLDSREEKLVSRGRERYRDRSGGMMPREWREEGNLGRFRELRNVSTEEGGDAKGP